MNGLRKFLLNANTLVFLFCLAVIIGPAISTLLNFELHVRCTDCYAYKGVALFEFEQSAVRRYRIIVPFMAAGINQLFGGVFDKARPEYFHGDFSLPVSFFLVNITIMCLYGVVIYRYITSFGLSAVAALTGLLTMLTCRWTSFWAAMPMVDSLYCLVTALMLLAIREKNTKLLIFTIFIGPFAKEAFAFFLPVIFFHSHIPKKKLVLYILLSGILIFAYRYAYEYYAGLPAHSGNAADVGQVNYFKRYWAGLFTPKGLYKVVSNFGLWILIPVLGALSIPKFLQGIKAKLPSHIWLFLAAVFVHMLFGAYERHMYLAMPVICLFIAFSAEELLKRYRTRLVDGRP